MGIVGKILTRSVRLDIFQKLKVPLKDIIDAEADVVSNFHQIEMTSRKVGVSGYNILPLDVRVD